MTSTMSTTPLPRRTPNTSGSILGLQYFLPRTELTGRSIATREYTPPLGHSCGRVGRRLLMKRGGAGLRRTFDHDSAIRQ
jgi:hypothetical protein